MLLMAILQTYGNILNPCIYAYGADLLIFCYILLRAYVSLNSFVIAFGRYVFVVHDNQVLEFGVEKLGKILIWSSFMVPFLGTILSLAVLTLNYNGWLLEIREYENFCSMSEEIQDIIFPGETTELYKSPIYKFVHSKLPSWATESLYIFVAVTSIILFSNISEGIIYIRSAVFVYR